jgi:flagellar basal body-associated protein FliL
MAEKPGTPSAPAKAGANVTAEEMAQAEKILGGDAAKAKEAEGKGAAAASASPKKKKKGKKGPSLGTRLKLGVKSAGTQFVDMVRSVASSDRPTRRMSVFFFLSLIGVVVLSVMLVRHNSRVKREREAHELALREAQAERDAEASILGTHEAADKGHGASMLNLGLFTIALKPVAERSKKGSFVDMAEAELFAECDSQATHDFLEENLAQARSQLSGVFLGVDREELLTREGKRKLKKRVLELLNGWLPRGKVKNIYFSKLIVA